MKRMISAVILISMATLLPARGFFERASGRVVGNGDFQTREVDLAPFAQAEVGVASPSTSSAAPARSSPFGPSPTCFATCSCR